MSSRSTWWFLDLLAVALYAAGAGAALYLGVVEGTLRAVVAMPLVVVLPGYALIALVYPSSADEMDEPNAGLRAPIPRRQSIDGAARVALSVAASIAVVPALWLIADFTPFGIAFLPILVSIVAFTVLFAILALLARWRTAPEHRFSPVAVGLLFGASSGRGYGRRGDSSGTTVFNVALVVSLLLVVSSVGFAVVNQPPGQQFTELYPKTEPVDGQTETMYPDQFAAGQSQTLPMVVHNHEGEDTKYTMVAVLQRVENNQTQQSAEVGRTSFALQSGQQKTIDLQMTPSMQGERLRLRILLYEGNAPNNPSLRSADYALPRLWVSVGESAPNQGSSNDDPGGEDGGSTDDGSQGDGSNDGDSGGNDGDSGGNDGGRTTTTPGATTTTNGGGGGNGGSGGTTTTTSGAGGTTTTTTTTTGGGGGTTTATTTSGGGGSTTTTTDDGVLARAPPSR